MALVAGVARLAVASAWIGSGSASGVGIGASGSAKHAIRALLGEWEEHILMVSALDASGSGNCTGRRI